MKKQRFIQCDNNAFQDVLEILENIIISNFLNIKKEIKNEMELIDFKEDKINFIKEKIISFKNEIREDYRIFGPLKKVNDNYTLSIEDIEDLYYCEN